MDEFVRMVLVVLVGWGITFLMRAIPFLLFAGETREVPRWALKFGTFISPIIIAVLIVYSYSGLAWKTAWPYCAGALTIGLQLAFRNGLLSILSGTILYMILLAFCGGCAATKTISLDVEDPSISVHTSGITLDNRIVTPVEVVEALRDNDIPQSRVIHIYLEPDVRNLSEARTLMGVLCAAGYRRPVLVTKRHSESFSVEKKGGGR